MSHQEIFEKFKERFPLMSADVCEWYPNGKDSIRIRCYVHKEDYIFTYRPKGRCQLQTITQAYLELMMKGGSDM